MSRVSTPSESQPSAPRPVRAAVLTISDTRTPDTDHSGQYLCRQLERSGHTVYDYRLVNDDEAAIAQALGELLSLQAGGDIVLCTGGTGLAGRDNTLNVVGRLLTKPLPGFGELFRMLSYREVGAAAMLSRAAGGRAGACLLFALPGSLNAVTTAWEGIFAPELGHLVYELRRQG